MAETGKLADPAANLEEKAGDEKLTALAEGSLNHSSGEIDGGRRWLPTTRRDRML